jgi:drug/metabolite transporter (DMT)-like permease
LGSGPFNVLAAACLWGTIGTTYVLIQARVDIDEITLVTLRALGAAVLVLVWFGVRDRSVFAVRPSDIGRMIAFGLVSVTAFYLALIYAFRFSGVAVGTLLLYLAPTLVTLGAALWLNDPVTPVRATALLFSLAGCLLIVEVFDPASVASNLVGFSFGLAAAATYASYSLMAKPLMRRYRAGTLLVWNLPVGALGLLLIKLVVSPFDWPGVGQSFGMAIYCGLMLSLLPVAFYSTGLRQLAPSEASILATVEPVVAMGLAMMVLRERLGLVQLGGAVLIVGSIVLLATVGRVQRVSRV